ncbi:unnamed protein product [Rotaria sp. Silwood2]|nr:unnamed protein product [Rotaria sp. Silwood2]CAF3135716.1 unnamed protein product [Rotaria sp. Silwood2]CAF3937303.1 unnamed protein product [Rotaria sp. Silwood2]CAF4053544.1 unnamed protein product [Rotaria sp. Silwood2]
MSQACSRKLATAVASRIYTKQRRNLRKTISNHTIIAATSFLSKKYDLLPCFCEHDPIRITKRCQALNLSKSSNAFWHRKSKSKVKLVSEEQQRNNSTAFENQQAKSSHSRNFQTFRKSIIQRFKRNNKQKMPTITARSVIHKRTNTYPIKHRNNADHSLVDSSNPVETNFDQPSSTRDDSQHSSYDSYQLILQDNSNDTNNKEEKNDTLELPLSSLQTEQQNINATNKISQTIQETSQTIMNDLDSSRKAKQTAVISQKQHSNKTRNVSTRTTTGLSKGKTSSKRKRISKPKMSSKISLSKKKIITTSKPKNITASLSVIGSTTNVKRTTYERSPFSNPNIFHSMPRMQNSDEITKDNVYENHLCCKPITSVKGLSIDDKKKLIEHDYLTLISLLPIYLDSQGNFQHKIREKTNISHDSAVELDRLMNEWGSARLFIGANSPYKTLSQNV